MNERWPFRVGVLPDEIFSSWLSRVAIEHSCDPISLTGFLWPDWRPWMTDIDRGIAGDRLDILCKGLNLDLRNLHQTFLHQVADQIGQIRTYGIWDWITTLGSRNRKRISGLQCCSQCLNSDSIPYFRRRWRFAWHCCCDKHKIRLINSCHSCKAPIMPHLVKAENKSLKCCPNCLSNLACSDDVTVSDDEVTRQLKIDLFLSELKGGIGQDKVDIKQWFLILKLMINILSRKLNKKHLSMINLRDELIGDGIQRSDNEYGIPFESMGPIQRSKLINQAWPILEMDLGEIILIFKNHNISINSLKELVSIIPKAFEVLPKNNYKKNCNQEFEPVDNYQSKNQVLKAFKKLIRRNKSKLLGMDIDK